MLFPTIDFAIFFAVAFTANWLLNPYPRSWKLAMIALSYFFYSWWDWRFVFLLAASTVIAQVGAAAVNRFPDERRRRAAMVASVAALLGLLGWFKYYGFVAVNADNFLHLLGGGHLLPLLAVTLPVGISFFTFMALSYVIDVYRRRLEPARPIDLAVYLSFFPHLVAGPIVRGEELLPQIRRRRDARSIDFGRAAWLVAAGLFKKVVVSSYIDSAIVTPVFSSPTSIRRSRCCSPSTASPSRSTPTSAGTPTSPSGWRCCSASASPTTSTLPTPPATSRTSGAAGT